MPKQKRRSRSARNLPRKPVYAGVRTVLWAVAAGLAAFAVVEWAAPLWGVDPRLAVFTGGVFALSAAVTPVVTGLLAHARGAALAGLLLVCGAFGAVDAAGWTVAAWRLEARLAASETAYQTALAAWSAEETRLLAALAAAETAEAALPASAEACEGLGPQGCEKRLEGLAADRAAAAGRTALAAGALAHFRRDEARPVPADLFDNGLIALVGGLLQLALAVAFWGVEAVAVGRHRAALAAAEAAEAAAAAAPKPKKTPAKPRAAKATAPAPKGLRLVVSNDN